MRRILEDAQYALYQDDSMNVFGLAASYRGQCQSNMTGGHRICLKCTHFAFVMFSSNMKGSDVIVLLSHTVLPIDEAFITSRDEFILPCRYRTVPCSISHPATIVGIALLP